MITKKLKIIFGLSILLFVAHGMEEILTNFYDVDSQAQAIFGLFSSLSNIGAAFVTFQIMLWLLLIVSFLLLLGEKLRFRMLAIIGLAYIYELYHTIKAIQVLGYYPGFITGLAFPFVAVLFWKEWFRIRKMKL